MHTMTIRPRSDVLDVKLNLFVEDDTVRVWVTSPIDSSPMWPQSLLEVFGSSPKHDPTCLPRLLTGAEVEALSMTQIYDGEFVFKSVDGNVELVVEYCDSTEVKVRSESAELLERVRQRFIREDFLIEVGI